MIPRFEQWLNESESLPKYEDLYIIEVNDRNIGTLKKEIGVYIKTINVNDIIRKNIFDKWSSEGIADPIKFLQKIIKNYALKLNVLDILKYVKRKTISSFSLSDIDKTTAIVLLQGNDVIINNENENSSIIESINDIPYPFYIGKCYITKKETTVEDYEKYFSRIEVTHAITEKIVKNFLYYFISFNDEDVNKALIDKIIRELNTEKNEAYIRFIDLDLEKTQKNQILELIKFIQKNEYNKNLIKNLVIHFLKSNLSADEYLNKYKAKIKTNKYGI
jgi:hypothetical protein